MAIQSKNGKAFEYACLIGFKRFLEVISNTVLFLYVEAVIIAQNDY